MNTADLDILFRDICVPQPLPKHLEEFRKYPDRREVIDYLANRVLELPPQMDGEEKWDGDFEYGIVHACHLLGEFKAVAAIEPLIEILDRVKDDCMAELYSASITALQAIGPPVLEPVFARYLEDRADVESATVWLEVLTNLKIKDERIRDALWSTLFQASEGTTMLIADYGDRTFQPVIELMVERAAEYLNRQRIDPFDFKPGLMDPVSLSYVNLRESLVQLREEGLDLMDPKFDAAMEALDRKLLRHADFDALEKRRKEYAARGQGIDGLLNSPCICGSSEKFKDCCGKLPDGVEEQSPDRA